MKLTRYNAKDTVITVNGVHITGLAENMWNFEKSEALAEDTVGAQGDVYLQRWHHRLNAIKCGRKKSLLCVSVSECSL